MPNNEGIANFVEVNKIISTHTEEPLHTELSSLLMLVGTHRDKRAFTDIFTFFSPKIKYFGIKQLNSDTLAAELVQETLSRVWNKAHLYDASKGAATTWVYSIMRNASFDMLRKIKAKNELLLGDDIWPIETKEHSESEVYADHLMERQMVAYVDRLPQAQQLVVKGVYFQELSQEQLAKQLGIPIGTVKSRLRLALAKLKEQVGGTYD
ncbi:sigma-70 family RNA polymerase sigma factor [Shewanella sp. VB17]|uniref:sigma-70 family RNA polymerase sigma factor n=1 Tax=Shewanella sp. VB17 TaxID=2739432 RepID=UPI0015664DD6|nr:sigma-70 family RNA polymerase sigma factor [Shewanella sp. VB17]NRD74267.1 sigma-70 family RNA polymerase sigma factor [Shewanella sp. VB17]